MGCLLQVKRPSDIQSPQKLWVPAWMEILDLVFFWDPSNKSQEKNEMADILIPVPKFFTSLGTRISFDIEGQMRHNFMELFSDAES